MNSMLGDACAPPKHRFYVSTLLNFVTATTPRRNCATPSDPTNIFISITRHTAYKDMSVGGFFGFFAIPQS